MENGCVTALYGDMKTPRYIYEWYLLNSYACNIHEVDGSAVAEG